MALSECIKCRRAYPDHLGRVAQVRGRIRGVRTWVAVGRLCNTCWAELVKEILGPEVVA